MLIPSQFKLQKRILILTIRAIGDVVLITPILRLLKQKLPASYLAALADGPSAQVLHNNPHVDRLFIIDRSRSRQLPWTRQFTEWMTLISDIRRERFDIVIDLFSGPRSAILTWLSGAPACYSEDFRRALRGFLYNRPVKIVRDGSHLVEQKLELIRSLVGKAEREDTWLETCLTQDEMKAIKPVLEKDGRENRRVIGFVPGAGSIWRIWPAERFAELGDLLVKEYDADIILLGGKDDIPICRRIADLMVTNPMDLSGKTTLRELMAILSVLDLVVTNVTGPLHLASACSKPKVIGLYGAADTIQYAPWGTNVTMVTKGKLEDAYWQKVDYRRDYEYLLQITVADVFDTVRKVMRTLSTG